MKRFYRYGLFCFCASVVLTGLDGDYLTFPFYLLATLVGAGGVVLINRLNYD